MAPRVLRISHRHHLRSRLVRSVRAGLPRVSKPGRPARLAIRNAAAFCRLPRRLPRRPLPPLPGPTPPPPRRLRRLVRRVGRAERAAGGRAGKPGRPVQRAVDNDDAAYRSTLSMCSPSCRNSPGCQSASRRSRRCALRACPASSDRRTACPCTPRPAGIGGVARIAIFDQLLMLCPHIHISGARVEVSPGGSLE